MNTTPQLIDAANELLQHGITLQDLNRSQNQSDYALDIFLRHIGAAVRYATALSHSGDVGEVGQLLFKAGSVPGLKDGKKNLGDTLRFSENDTPAPVFSLEEIQLANEKYLAQVKSMSAKELEIYFSRNGLVQLIKQINQTAANPLPLDSEASDAELSNVVFDYLQST